MFLGIDTSCYTTSVAVVGQDGRILADRRQLLQVGEGEKGLQQSKAVWQHLQKLPDLVHEIFARFNPAQFKGIAVSAGPRPVPGSYLPVFIAGSSQAKTIAYSLQIPLYETTHQEGHLMAGFINRPLPENDFLAFHLSGGTSELLKITIKTKPFGFTEVLLGKTLDLHAGQFIDRVGVALGLPFPSGPALEELARSVTRQNITLPSATKNLDFSFSGPESHAQRLIAAGVDKREIARGVEQCLVNTLHKIISRAIQKTGIKDVLIVGGVGANNYIRQALVSKLKPGEGKLFFAEPGMSTDNGVGVALIGRHLWQN